MRRGEASVELTGEAVYGLYLEIKPKNIKG
jgi:hypothetical protein